jgi:hypothetical protein
LTTTPTAADPSRRRLGALLARVAVSAAILAWLGTHVDWSHVARSFRGVRWGFWAAGVGLYIVCQLLCCVRWLWLSRPMGFHQSLARFTGIYFVGMFFNLFLPTSVGGDAVRAVYLANGSGRRVAAVLSVLLDRASGLFVLIGLACAAAAVSPVPLPPRLRLMVWGIGAGAAVALAALPLTANALGRVTGGRPRQVAGAALEALALFRRRPALLVGTTLLSVAVQVFNAAVLALIGLGLRLDVPLVYYGLAAPLVTLFTLVPVSLNGMGLREGGMVLVLGPAGATPADAVGLAFLWFLAQTSASVLGAGVYLFGRLTPPEGLPGERPAIDRDPGDERAGQRRAAA